MSQSSYTTPQGANQSRTTSTYGYHTPPTGPYAQGSYAATYQSAYTTGITGYGSWPYPYTYAQQPSAYTPKPATSTPGASTSTGVASQAGPQRSTFSYAAPYAPYRRDTQTSSNTATNTTARGSRKPSNLKGLFTKELKSLMFGFGDDRNPANDTVNVMEEILIEYICDVCQIAGGSSRKTRLSIEDLRRTLSRLPDARKLARMEELLFMQEDIKRARAQIDDSDIIQSKSYLS